jgi:hypothetical protein
LSSPLTMCWMAMTYCPVFNCPLTVFCLNGYPEPPTRKPSARDQGS